MLSYIGCETLIIWRTIRMHKIAKATTVALAVFLALTIAAGGVCRQKKGIDDARL